QTDVRLTRSEFEQLVRPSLADTIGSMQRAIRGADLAVEDIDLILLVGGSSRIPLVGQMVAGELGRPVAVDAHPKHSIALGAARAAAEPGAAHLEQVVADDVAPEPVAEPPTVAAIPETPAAPSTPEAPVPPERSATVAPSISEPASSGGAAPPAQPLKVGSDDGDNKRNTLIGAGAVVLLLLVIAVAAIALSGGGDDPDTDPVAGGVETTAAVVETTAPATTAAPTTAAPTTAAPSTTTTTTTTTEAPFACPGGFCAHIEGITVEGGELVIEWTSHNYEPDVNNLHAHFYFDIYDANQVGTNWQAQGAASIGSWVLTDVQPFVTNGAVSMTAIPPDATSICVVPTDSSHGVLSTENAECVLIPDEIPRG
ncbi:MAG: Hsp70 family protein, partial [Actinomycetota bacterium]|nr:Hsp70 family protein [Actinomycetota bacterium]